ncbi:MAG: S41 family peptidase [Acidobacteriia bacterium]|nr:S41 family peptidase [Terriglobia bacterium]MYK11610.1 S41 family peptidase [Terriglobia bacterium]
MRHRTDIMRVVRPVLLMTAVVAVCAVLGGLYGLRIGTNGNFIQMAPINGQLHLARQATRVIEQRFAREVQWDDAIYEGAIPGMLATLDPHSTFLDTENFLAMREQERGSYAGVGVQIVSFGSKTIIDFPFPETPAFEAGIRPGDAIEMVDGNPVNRLPIEEVASRLKGPAGTPVGLSLSRAGLDRWIEVELVRHVIPRPTIPTRLLFEDGTAYLHLTSFGERTPDELEEALDRMESQGMTGLVLDLRGNKGGLLSAGVRVASHFLEPGQSVVSHRGRASPERHYRAKSENPNLDYPIVVLVNCGSASASEIVAGALQDHDRALIAGSGTFGKGLVQSVFALPESTGMVLTTARYYSPSGRLIQRPYASIAPNEYFTEPCSEQYRPQQGTVRLTDSGRKVYEFGGIAPDVEIEGLRRTTVQRLAGRHRAVERFVARLRARGYAMLKGETPSPDMLADLLTFMGRLGIPTGPQIPAEDRQFLMRALATHLHVSYFDYDEGQRIRASYDPVILRARSLLAQAARLMEKSQIPVS